MRSASGIVSGLSARDGTPGWRTSVWQVGQGGQVGPTSQVLELSLQLGTLYAATADGNRAAINTVSGRIRWRAPADRTSADGATGMPPAHMVVVMAP